MIYEVSRVKEFVKLFGKDMLRASSCIVIKIRGNFSPWLMRLPTLFDYAKVFLTPEQYNPTAFLATNWQNIRCATCYDSYLSDQPEPGLELL